MPLSFILFVPSPVYLRHPESRSKTTFCHFMKMTQNDLSQQARRGESRCVSKTSCRSEWHSDLPSGARSFSRAVEGCYSRKFVETTAPRNIEP